MLTLLDFRTSHGHHVMVDVFLNRPRTLMWSTGLGLHLSIVTKREITLFVELLFVTITLDVARPRKEATP